MASKKPDSLTELTKTIIALRDERDWKQFHNPKDLAISINLEAAEVLEHFQWKTNEEIKEYIVKEKEAIGNELSDILAYILIMSHDLDIDLADVFYKKREADKKKYPVAKAKGKHTKYTKL